MAKKASPKPTTTPDVNRVRTTFYIDKSALAALQTRNRETGIPVAYMIRLAIDQFLGRELNKAAGATARTIGTVEELNNQ
jgi:hypothetical protein